MLRNLVSGSRGGLSLNTEEILIQGGTYLGLVVAKPRKWSSLKFQSSFFPAQTKLETVKCDRQENWNTPTDTEVMWWLPPIHSPKGGPENPNLLVWLLYLESLLGGDNCCHVWELWGKALLSRINRTEGKLFLARRPWDQETGSLFSTSANESPLQTQIISLCLSFTFYKVEIIIPIPPYFLSVLWKLLHMLALGWKGLNQSTIIAIFYCQIVSMVITAFFY